MSAEHVSQVIFHAMFFQQRDEFLIEGHFSVMHLLGPDVPNHRVHV